MSGRTIRFRTVVLALLCVVSLLAAPATAVATPENPFGGDSTEQSGDGIGDTLDGSSETDSTNDSDDSTSDSSDGDSDGDLSSDSDDSDGTADSSEGSDSSTLSGADSDDSAGDDSDTSDSGTDDGSTAEDEDGSAAEDDDESAGEDSSLRSTLATSVNTTVGSTTDATADAAGAVAPDSWSSLDDRTATLDSSPETGDSVSGVDWSALGDTAESTLAVEDGEEPSLDVPWDESSLSERERTGTASLSGTLGGVTSDVLTGVDAVVDVAAVDTSLSSPPTTQSTTAGEPSAGLAESRPAATGPTDTGSEADGAAAGEGRLVDTETASVAGAGAPTPLGSSPGSGFAVGIGGVAALAAVRQGLFSATGTGIAANASALAATVTPALAGRSSALDRLVRMLTAFRYSRYDDSDPLEHDARADVFEVVEETPGAYLSEVAEQADLPLSTARHHVRVLEREELLTGAKVRGKRRFYPAYTGDIELAAAMNDESTAVVLDALSRLGGASVSELADELGRDPSTVTHHLQRLEEDDIVVREREGRAVINRLSAEARTALDPETEAPARAEASGVVASD